jgi:hypothetical protein
MRSAFTLFGAIVGLCSAANAANLRGTTEIVAATLDECSLAITNAFEDGRYHGMLFIQSDVQWDSLAKIWSKVPATNEWSLSTGELPIALIRKGNKIVRYDAQFEITASPEGTNRCKVTVLTTSAWVPGGKEPNIHGGGWVISGKDIPPVLEEETNVLSRIEKQLISMQKGNPRPLPPTADRAAIMGRSASEAQPLRQ